MLKEFNVTGNVTLFVDIFNHPCIVKRCTILHEILNYISNDCLQELMFTPYCREHLIAWNLNAIQQCITEIYTKIDVIYKESIQNHYQAICSNNNIELTARNNIKLNLIELVVNYGHYLYKRERYKDAKKYYEQSLRLDPDHLSALTQMGMCLTKESAYVAARAYFEVILKRTIVTKEQAHALLNIACTYRLQRNMSKAAEYLRQAKRLCPLDVDIRKEEVHLRQAVAAQTLVRAKKKFFSDESFSDTTSSQYLGDLQCVLLKNM